jgi:deazaflavin-dependent oxidoreductase (nitroreductase family)
MMDPAKKPEALDSPLVGRIIKRMSKANVWVYRKTNGRIGGTWRIGAGFRKPVPVCLLEHTGRKTGLTRTSPLLFLRDGGRIVLVASQGGRAADPIWYRNLQANPEAVVQVKGERIPVTARTAGPEERAELWPKLLDLYADFATYDAWTEREIPVVVLQPR